MTGAQGDGQVTLSNLRIGSTADIVRNLTASETDTVLIVVLVLVGAVIFGLIVVAVLIVRRIVRRRRESSRGVTG